MLGESDFTRFNQRNAWRANIRAIEVVNFQSFNSHKAASLRCTSYSFALNLGVYYLDVHEVPWRDELPTAWQIRPERPEEPRSHARLHPTKAIVQSEYPRPNIWSIKDDGSNVSEAVGDAARVIGSVGLPWLAKFREPATALQEFLLPHSLDRKKFVAAFGTLAAARTGSAIAIAERDFATAIRLWQAVLDKPNYAKMTDVVAEAAKRIDQIESLAEKAASQP